MKNEYNDELIQAYLEGKLEGDDLAKMNREIIENPELAEEINKLKKLELGLEGIGADQLRDEIRNWEKDYRLKASNQKGKVRSLRTYYSVAAVILLLIVSGIVIYLNQSPDYNALYAENFTPYEDMILDRGENETSSESELTEGMEAYNNHQYEVAAQKLSSYLTQNSEKPGVALYIGISQMELNHMLDAIKYLDLAQQDPLFAQQAQWYLALLFVKNNQIDKARNQLSIISKNDDHYKRSEAKDLLRKIK